MKPLLVSLRWMDAHATAGTTAYELHELPHKASEDAGGGMFRGITFVPRALIVELKPVKRQRKKADVGPA